MRPWAIGIVALAACGGEPPDLPESQPLTCATGCGGALGSATLPGPHGAISLTAWSNSPQLGTDYDCDPTACAGNSPVTARNGHPAYGCPWQCVELVNRYFQGSWGAPKIAANAGATFCQTAASNSLPQYWVYGQYGASTAGHAPMAGDVLVWAGHVAIATNSVSPGAAGTIGVIEQNATCSGFDSVSWSGSMFGAKYNLAPLCWVHVLANDGITGPICPTGGNWHGAGDYCGSEPGMQSAAANTLYACNAAGGSASVVQACSYGCQQMPAGQNDRCAPAPPPPPPPPPPPDAGVDAGTTIDAGVDAGTGIDAGVDAGIEPADAGAPDDAGIETAATDAGKPAVRVEAPPDAPPAGCSSGSATSLLAALAFAILRRRCRPPVLSP